LQSAATLRPQLIELNLQPVVALITRRGLTLTPFGR
jgi:hypothetical protein